MEQSFTCGSVVLRASSTTPLAQEYVADCALRGSNSRFYGLRQFAERLKSIPKKSCHDGWQLCGDGTRGAPPRDISAP
jgi:hypothetical protein